MKNKIDLTYNSEEFIISINGKVISKEKDMETALSKFKDVVNENNSGKAVFWQVIENEINNIELDGLVVNSQYKSLEYKCMKYFYTTDQVFYIDHGKMVPLIGGYKLFNFVVTMLSIGKMEDLESFMQLCRVILEHKSLYRLTESSIFALNPGFNYGSVEYNFLIGKINKGSSIEKCNFEEYKSYVLERLRLE